MNHEQGIVIAEALTKLMNEEDKVNLEWAVIIEEYNKHKKLFEQRRDYILKKYNEIKRKQIALHE